MNIFLLLFLLLLLLLLLLQLLQLAQFACQWAAIRLWQSARTSWLLGDWLGVWAGCGGARRGWAGLGVWLMQMVWTIHLNISICQRSFWPIAEDWKAAICCCHFAPGKRAMRVLNSFNHKNVNHKALMPRPKLFFSTLPTHPHFCSAARRAAEFNYSSGRQKRPSGCCKI